MVTDKRRQRTLLLYGGGRTGSVVTDCSSSFKGTVIIGVIHHSAGRPSAADAAADASAGQVSAAKQSWCMQTSAGRSRLPGNEAPPSRGLVARREPGLGVRPSKRRQAARSSSLNRNKSGGHQCLTALFLLSPSILRAKHSADPNAEQGAHKKAGQRFATRPRQALLSQRPFYFQRSIVVRRSVAVVQFFLVCGGKNKSVSLLCIRNVHTPSLI